MILKFNQLANLFHSTLSKTKPNGLSKLLGHIQRCSQTEFKSLLAVIINSQHLKEYFNQLKIKERSEPITKLQLINFDDISSLLKRSVKKFKKLEPVPLDTFGEYSPKNIATYLFTLLVLVSRTEDPTLSAADQTLWKSLVFSV